MKVQLEKRPTPYLLTITTEAEVVKAMIEEEYEKIKSSISAHGFRKGTVPRNIAESQKNFDKFSQYRNVISRCFENGIVENNLSVVSHSDMSILGEFSDHTPLVIQANVVLVPKILKFDIEDVVVERNSSDISDADVEEEINSLKTNEQKLTPVDPENYVLNTGDEMNIDFVGSIDNVEFAGGTAKGFKYVVGVTQFIPGFHEQLVLIKPGQSGLVNVKFPDNYGNEKLKGKDATFNVTVNSIFSCEKPTTEQLAEKSGKSVDEFRLEISNRIKLDRESVSAEQLRVSVLKKAIEVSEIEPIPDQMIENELQGEWEKTISRLGMSEKEVEKKFMKKSVFFLRKKEEMSALVKTKILLLHVADTENISVSEEEMVSFITNRAKELKREDELETLLNVNVKNSVNRRILESTIKQEKAVDWIFDHCSLNA